MGRVARIMLKCQASRLSDFNCLRGQRIRESYAWWLIFWRADSSLDANRQHCSSQVRKGMVLSLSGWFHSLKFVLELSYGKWIDISNACILMSAAFE